MTTSTVDMPPVEGRVLPVLGYRPDIDGLRALAVIIVILFHAEIRGFEGGYVGVDVFFVISGYLITQRIVAGAESGGFSFWKFYSRRVRRLLPPALSTIIATLAVGVVLLPPDALRRLAISVAAAALSVSNVLFFAQSGYWDTDAVTKPLLHTWSLGVEEQFYLIWPILIVALIRWKGRGAITALLGIGAGAVVVTAWMTGVNEAAAFFLTPFRIFQFVAGAACVWFDRSSWPAGWIGSVGRVSLWFVGLVAICAPAALYSEATSFPGLAALVPTLGTAAVILARRPDRLDGLLSNGVMRHIGLISYSLYLLHWPVLVYGRHLGNGVLSTPTILVSMVVTLVLAELQHRFVEQRFRLQGLPRENVPNDTPRRSFRRLALPALAAAIVLSLSGVAVAALDGFPQRYASSIRDLAAMSRDDVNVDRNEIRASICGSDQPPMCGSIAPTESNVLVIGDSHTADGINVMAAAAPDANLLVGSHGGCPPFLDLKGTRPSYADCAEFNVERLAAIESLASELDLVVISTRLDPRRVDPTVVLTEWLQSLGLEVAVLGVGPHYQVDARDVVVAEGTLADLEPALTEVVIAEQFTADEELEERIEQLEAIYVPKLEFFCPEGSCRPFVSGTTDLAIFDGHHLTAEGARAFGHYLRSEPWVRALSD